MGTHPIFESDFDCLTVNQLPLFQKCRKRWRLRPLTNRRLKERLGPLMKNKLPWLTPSRRHWPVVFENNDIPYVFVPSKHDLGASIGSKRPRCVLLIKPNEAYMEEFGKCTKEVTKLPTALTTAA